MRSGRLIMGAVAAVAVAAGCVAMAQANASPQRAPAASVAAAPVPLAVDRDPVILDEDNDQLDDGAQSMFMLLQAHANLIGITTVAGNTWVEEGEAYTLAQENLIGRHIPVYPGANVPLSGDRRPQLDSEQQLYGPVTYIGAWDRPQPPSYRTLPHPPYGGYARQRPEQENAADFIIAQAHKYPHKLTIIAGGAFTNIALAVRKDPSIVPLVKRIIYMGGAVTVPGNTSVAAEFNVWFDPLAAKIAFTAPWKEQILVPLDVTNKVLYGKPQYDRIVAGPSTPIKEEFKALQGPGFADDPDQTSFVYDEVATAIFLDPTLIKTATKNYVDVDATYGLDFGRVIGYPEGWKPGATGPAGSQPMRVVSDVDIDRFFDLYTGLLHQR